MNAKTKTKKKNYNRQICDLSFDVLDCMTYPSEFCNDKYHTNVTYHTEIDTDDEYAYLRICLDNVKYKKHYSHIMMSKIFKALWKLFDNHGITVINMKKEDTELNNFRLRGSFIQIPYTFPIVQLKNYVLNEILELTGEI